MSYCSAGSRVAGEFAWSIIKVAGAVDFTVVLGPDVVAELELVDPHAARANETVAVKIASIPILEALRLVG